MNRRGQTLAALMIAIAIIAILAAVLYIGPSVLGGGKKGSPRADKLGNSTLSLSKLEAEDQVCRSNIQQVRSAVQMSTTTEDQPPASLDELSSVRSISKCPIGGEAYVYDPATGSVTCPHPGHEKF
jgi:Tfp pilus assembly protein FimT